MTTRRGLCAPLVLAAALGLLSACNFAPLPQGGATPTVQEPVLTSAPSLLPSATLTVPPSPQPTVEILPTATPLPPSETTLPTATPGPYEHVIQRNETLLYIIQLYGYRDMSVLPEVVRMNDSIPNADTLPGPGSVIFIPRQTATPTPEAAQQTPTLAANLPGVAPTSAQTGLNVDTPILNYQVIEGDTIVGIADNWGTTLEVLARLNPEVPFFGCNFEIPSGGPRCNPPLQIGQVINVPAPTPTPTLSPTPSGSETPTPTPTFAAPRIISPPQDASIQPQPFRLDWVSVGVLQEGEVYLVEVINTATGQKSPFITRETSLLLPASLIPTDGQTTVFNWTVSVAKPNEQGIYRIISGTPVVRTFRWQSR